MSSIYGCLIRSLSGVWFPPDFSAFEHNRKTVVIDMHGLLQNRLKTSKQSQGFGNSSELRTAVRYC